MLTGNHIFAAFMDRVLQGSIFHQHPQKRMFSVQLENGDYSVIELKGEGSVNFGDVVKGHLDGCGETVLFNQTTLTDLPVTIHHIRCTRVEALQRATMN